MMTNIVCSAMYEVDGRREKLDISDQLREQGEYTVAGNIKIEPIPLDIDLTVGEIFEKIKPVIVEYLGITDESRVTPEASLQTDLNADSLDTVELVMAAEEMFKITTEDKDFDDVHNIGEFCNVMLNKRREERAKEVTS